MALLARNADTIDYKTRLAIVVQAVLLSPKFLFRPEIGDRAMAGERGVPLTSWEVASRLSFFLTGSIPDAELAGAAEAGTLTSPDEIGNQTRRLLALPRAQTQLVRSTTSGWGRTPSRRWPRTRKAFPNFTPLTAFGFAKETDHVHAQRVVQAGRQLRDLMLADYTFANGPLAGFYGVAAPATDWDRVELDPQQRVGLLTQAALLATMAKQDRTDPVRRGKFVLERILCRSRESAVAGDRRDVQAAGPEQDGARAVTCSTPPNPECATCHKVLDPLGLPFEHYDSIGRWLNDDRGMAIDASGEHRRARVQRRARAGADAGRDAGGARLLRGEWLRFSQGKLKSDADQANVDWLMTRFSRDTRVVDLVVAIVAERQLPLPASRRQGRRMERRNEDDEARDAPSPSAASRAGCRAARCSRARWASASRCPGWS